MIQFQLHSNSSDRLVNTLSPRRLDPHVAILFKKNALSRGIVSNAKPDVVYRL